MTHSPTKPERVALKRLRGLGAVFAFAFVATALVDCPSDGGACGSAVMKLTP